MSELGARLDAAFAQHAARVAVLDRGRAYLYGQLAARVAQVSATLRSAGVREGTLVALGGERDVLRVADLVALFRVGACPLLLCPRWPAAYREACVARSGARWSLVAGVLTPTRVADPDRGAPPPLPAELAYVVFTSGSAGVPKGVLVPQAGLVPVLDAQVRAFGLSPESRSLFMLGLGFDASLSDLGTALLAGATLVLEDEVACAPGRLTETLARRDVTYVDLPPAYLASLDERRLPPSLTTLVIGGEVPPAREVRRLSSHVRLFNVYGPSEATICTSIARCDPDWSRPFIGQPIAGNRYLLRDGGREGPEGREGELVIEGPGVAYGYLGDEARTHERFTHGAGRALGAFRTGDLVRHTASGEWEFLGRVDRQLKRRGQLVAPEHVEAALLRAGPLAAASVSVAPDEQLVAAVERLPSAAGVDAAELATGLLTALRETLPASLVPDRVTVVDALPRGTTGKVAHQLAAASASREARAALDADVPEAQEAARGSREAEAAVGEGAPEAQGTAREAAGIVSSADARWALLGALMGAALRQAPLGPDDDFYACGGDSLRALEVVARAEAGGLLLSVADVVRGRTPRATLACADSGARALRPRAGLEAQAAQAARALRPRTGLEAQAAEAARASRGLAGPRLSSTGGLPPTSLRGAQVLLTGATGTLGSALLEPLRAAVGPEGRVHCLVRRPDAQLGPEPGARGGLAPVSLVLGDVTEPHLGLAGETYQTLAEDVGVVLHGAAQLSAAAPHVALMEVNVSGTQRVLELAFGGRPKALLHVSTLSVFTDAAPRPERCLEQNELRDVTGFTTDYAASKWAAERLLRMAGQPAPNTTIVRLGLLTGDRAGQGASRGHLARVVRGLAALGALPPIAPEQLAALRFDVTPVDHAAGALLALLAHDLRRSVGGTYHVAAAQPVSFARLLDALRLEGVTFETCSWPELCNRAAGCEDAHGDAVLAALSLGRLGRLGRGGAADDPALDLFAATGTHFSLVDTQRALSGTACVPPEPDEALLRRYVRSALA